MADVGISGSQLSITLTTLASQSPRISGRATAVANDASLIANVLSELDEVTRRTVTGCHGETKILNEKGFNTISTHCETCLRTFGTIHCEVDNQLKAKYSCPGKPGMQKAAEDIFLEPRMDQLRLEVKEAKEALMLVLQVALLARSRIVSKAFVYLLLRFSNPSCGKNFAVLSISLLAEHCTKLPGNVPSEDRVRSCLNADQESLLIQTLKAKVSTRKPPTKDANSHGISPDDNSHNDADHSQEEAFETVDLTVSGSTLKSPFDTSTTLAPSEDEQEQIEGGSDLPDAGVDSTAQKDNQLQTCNKHQDPETNRVKSISRSERFAAEVNEPSSTQPLRSKIPYLKRDDSAAATGPGNLDTRREREADERSLKSAVSPVGTPSFRSTGEFSRYQQVSCLTMLRLLLSRRNSDRQHAESAEEIIENLPQRQVLSLVILRPYIRFVGQGYFAGWSNLAPETDQLEIARQLVSDRRKDSRPVTEQIAKLSITESEVIGGYMKARPDAALLSVLSTPVDLVQDGMKLHGIHETRFIFRMAGEPRPVTLLSDLPKRDLSPPRGNRRDRPSRAESFRRETYMKISLEYLDPRTLNAFGLPWEFDPDNQYMVIVKKYMAVEDQDALFDHSKKIRHYDQFRSVPSKALKDDDDDDEDGGHAAETSWKPSKSEIDSLFLRVDSRKELEEENKRVRVSPPVSKKSSSSDGEPSQEEEGSDVVELLLAKYTTIFDDLPAANVEPEWVPL
ncbi:hypothetical protein MMC30_004875 [Trapelia coarctata]|nr:hypothetical protein [Trapelia coarctata]